VVGYGELHGQAMAYGELVDEFKVVVAERTAKLCRSQREGKVKLVTSKRSEGQIPVLNAREAVAGAGFSVVTRTEPRKDDGYTAADGLAGSEVALTADEDDGLCGNAVAEGLPRGEMSTLQIDRGLRLRGCDIDVDEAGWGFVKG
jgi:hypothetical protein